MTHHDDLDAALKALDPIDPPAAALRREARARRLFATQAELRRSPTRFALSQSWERVGEPLCLGAASLAYLAWALSQIAAILG